MLNDFYKSISSTKLIRFSFPSPDTAFLDGHACTWTHLLTSLPEVNLMMSQTKQVQMMNTLQYSGNSCDKDNSA